MKPSVCHIQREYFPGQPCDIHAGILKEGHFDSHLFVDRVVLSGNDLSNLAPNSSYRSTTHWSQFDRIQNALERRCFSSLARYRFSSFLKKNLTKISPSLFHIHFGTTGAELIFLKNQFNVPYIVSFYGNDGSQALKDSKWLKLYQQMFLSADKFLVLCDAVRDRLIEKGCSPEKILIWDLPCDLSYYPYQPRSVPTREIRFITAARFVEKKGYPILLKALSEFLKSGLSAHLTILGFGPDRPKIEKLIHELELEKNVMIYDGLSKNFHHDYSKLLQNSDIFILPSQRAPDGDDEGGPALSLVYAQAAGLPVICTPFPGAERSVMHKETGILVPESNHHALKEAMIELARNPKSWNQLGKFAAELVQTRFSFDKQIKELANIYEALLVRK